MFLQMYGVHEILPKQSLDLYVIFSYSEAFSMLQKCMQIDLLRAKLVVLSYLMQCYYFIAGSLMKLAQTIRIR